MEIAFTKERVFYLRETIDWEEAKERAWDRKIEVFKSGLGKLFARPKPDDIKQTHHEKRWQPFWHVRCSARYIYDRTRHYQVPIPQPEVRTVVIDQREYIPSGDPRGFTLVGLEKCREDHTVERLANAVTGEQEELEHYLEFEPELVTNLAAWKPADAIVVQALVRASAATREVLTSLIKPLDADTVQQDLLTIELVDLYFRPVYAFEFHWIPKERKAIAEIDGLTGALFTEDATIRETLGHGLPINELLDVDGDAIDRLVPGGGAAIQLAQ